MLYNVWSVTPPPGLREFRIPERRPNQRNRKQELQNIRRKNKKKNKSTKTRDIDLSLQQSLAVRSQDLTKDCKPIIFPMSAFRRFLNSETGPRTVHFWVCCLYSFALYLLVSILNLRFLYNICAAKTYQCRFPTTLKKI